MADSFKELAHKKNIEKITVKDVVENCGYSPATFYRHFRDKYDLIAWDYSRAVEDNIRRVGMEGFTWKNAFLRCAYYHLEHREYLVNLFQNTRGLYSFEQHMTEVNVKFVAETIRARAGETSKLMERALWGYCYGAVKNNVDWLLGKFDATPEEMAFLYELSTPEALKPYLPPS